VTEFEKSGYRYGAEKSKVLEVFTLIKDKLAKIIDQYEITI
jgi:hypothetical protein